MMKKKFIYFFLLFIFFSFTLRHSSKMNSDNLVFLNLIKNSDYDVQIISTNVFSIFSFTIQKNKKKKRSCNRFAIELFSMFLRIFFVSDLKLKSNSSANQNLLKKIFFDLFTFKKKNHENMNFEKKNHVTIYLQCE